jgi:hypothetical protein
VFVTCNVNKVKDLTVGWVITADLYFRRYRNIHLKKTYIIKYYLILLFILLANENLCKAYYFKKLPYTLL